MTGPFPINHCAARMVSTRLGARCRDLSEAFEETAVVSAGMSDESGRPTAIELKRDSHLKLTWDDGVIARFDIADLRLACPCAGCRSRRDKGQRSIPDDGRPIAAIDARLVGSYALGVEWQDGRCSSIYSFDRLRAWAENPRTTPPDIG